MLHFPDGFQQHQASCVSALKGVFGNFRRADVICRACDLLCLVQVGGFTIFQNQDLGSVLPLWIKYTEDVRADPDVGNCLSHERSSTCSSMRVHWSSYTSCLSALGC